MSGVMMSGVMRVDPDGLRRIWPAFAAMSGRLDDLVAGLGAALDAEDGCWGADEVGTTFASSYVAAAQQTRGALGTLRSTTSDISAALMAVADNADACEQRVQDRC